MKILPWGSEMLKIRNYKPGFDPWGTLLFAVIMLPNVIWFLVPAPVDVLRNPSVTPTADAVASFFQMVMVAAICMLRNAAGGSPMGIMWRWGIGAAVLFYFAGWGFYYAGITSVMVVMDLCIAPCLAFILFALARKNAVALAAATGFMACHVYYGIVNFI